MLCLRVLTDSSHVVDYEIMKQLIKIVLELNENVKVLSSTVQASLKESMRCRMRNTRGFKIFYEF